MAIHSIDKLALYFKKDGFHPEKAGTSYYPMVSLLDLNGGILAAIKFSYSNAAWHVDNVVALSGYGPTIYQILMQLSGQNGLAPNYKPRASSKEFVVEKSKRIWRGFYESPSVKSVEIENKYQESYLNCKYILKGMSFDLEKAYANLDSIIVDEYRSQLSPWGRLKLWVAQESDDKELSAYKKIFIARLESSIDIFLKPSVTAHVKS